MRTSVLCRCIGFRSRAPKRGKSESDETLKARMEVWKARNKTEYQDWYGRFGEYDTLNHSALKENVPELKGASLNLLTLVNWTTHC